MQIFPASLTLHPLFAIQTRFYHIKETGPWAPAAITLPVYIMYGNLISDLCWAFEPFLIILVHILLLEILVLPGASLHH